MSNPITLTPDAEDKIYDLLSREDRDDLALRLAVQPGGCSGLIYQLYFDERELDGDHTFEYPTGVQLRIDRMSLPYLEGSKLEYSDSIEKQGFSLDNPNAGGTCACGGSFS